MGDNRKETIARSRESSTIKRLSKELRDKVRSGCNITSVEQCVQELVFNAIDAGATKIYVGINMKTFKVEVEDNGCGLSRADLELVGKRYVTSKCSSTDDLRHLNYYGYRGEALASIIVVSNAVKILTRPASSPYNRKKGTAGGGGGGHGSSKSYRLWFWNGKVSDTGIEEFGEAKRSSPGFTITIEGLLDNQPVRQKRLDRSAHLLDVRMALERIALVNPNISIELRNESNMSTILKYNPCFSHADAFDQLFSTKKKDAFNFLSENHLQDGLMFNASIGKQMYRQKCFQYLFVNKRCVEMRNRIHKVMNDTLSKLFFANEQQNNGTSKDNTTTKEKISSSPSDKLFPVFILNISCSLEKYCPQLDSKYGVEFFDWDSCIKGIEGIILKFQSRVFPTSSAAVDLVFPLNNSSGNKKTQNNQTMTLKERLSNTLSFEKSKDISTRDVKNAIHSRPAIREAVVTSQDEDSDLSSTDGHRHHHHHQHHVDLKATKKNKANMMPCTETLEDSDNDDDRDEVLTTTYSDLVASPSMMMAQNNNKRPVDVPSIAYKHKQSLKKSTAKHTVYNVRRRSPKNIVSSRKKIDLVRGGLGVPRSRKDIVISKKPVPILNRDVFNKFPPWNKKVVATTTSSSKVVANKRKANQITLDDDDDDNSSHQIVYKKPKYEDMLYKAREKLAPAKRGNNNNNKNVLLKHLIPEPRNQKPWEPPAGAGANRVLRANGVDDNEPKGRDWKLRRYLSDSQNGTQTIDSKDLNDSSEMDNDDEEDNSTSTKPFKKFPHQKLNQSAPDICDSSIITEKSLRSLSLKIRSSPGCSTRSGLMTSGNRKEISSHIIDLSESKTIQKSPQKEEEEEEEEKKDNFEEEDPFIKAMVASAQKFISSKNLDLAAEIGDVLNNHLKRKEIQKIRALEKKEAVRAANLRFQFKEPAPVLHVKSKPPTAVPPITQRPDSKPALTSQQHQNQQQQQIVAATPDPFGINKAMKEANSPSQWPPLPSGWNEVFQQQQQQPQPSSFVDFNLHDRSASEFPFFMPPPPIVTQPPPDPFMQMLQPPPSTATSSNVQRQYRPDWLRRYFPKGCDQLWKRDTNGSHNKPQINGNITATTNHLSEKVKEYIVKSTEEPDDVFDKWRSDARADAVVCNEFTCSTDHLEGLINSSSEYFGGPAGGEIPVTSLNGNGSEVGSSKVYNTMMSRSFKFKKEDLRKLKVISQWDRKFIVAKLTVDDFDESKKEGVKGPKDILVVLDQHAVHERIRLERLIDELYEFDKETGQKRLAAVRIEPSYKLNMLESEIRVLDRCTEYFMKIGIEMKIANSNTVKISAAPMCILKKAMMEPTSVEHTLALTRMLTDLIQEEIGKIQDTRTVTAAAIPKTIFNILCSQACHGAIKFGDELDLSVCEAMITSLQKCRAPFQCAHGRPSIVPLIELSSLLRTGVHQNLHRSEIDDLV